jgi:hypothetical protein
VVPGAAAEVGEVTLDKEADEKEQENIRKRRKEHVATNTDIKELVTIVERKNIRASIK